MQILIALFLSFLPFSFAKDPAYVGMLEFEDFKRLSSENKALYLHGIQSIATGLQQIHRTKIGYPKGRRPAAVERLCEYAGFLMQKTVDGDCPKPERGSCPVGMVQCQPFLFGEGVCAKEGPGATMQCRENARPASEILKIIEKDPAGWEKVSTELGSYCESDSETESCFYIRGRFWELNELAGMPSPPPVDVVQGGNDRKPISVWGDFNERMKLTGAGSAAADARIAEINAMAATERAKAEEKEREIAKAKQDLNAKKCQTSALAGSFRCPDSAEPESLMTVDEVNRIFCESHSVSDTELDLLRERLKRMEGCLRSTIAKSKGLQKTKAEASLASLQTSMKTNFEMCFKDLQAGKEVAANKLATLRKSGSRLMISPDDRKAVVISTDEEFLSPALGTQGVQICQLRIEGFEPEKTPLGTKKSGTGSRGRR